MTVRKGRRAALAAAIAFSAGLLGVALAAPPAAADAGMFHWRCGGNDSCQPGDNRCCTQYDHCSSMCPVIVVPQ